MNRAVERAQAQVRRRAAAPVATAPTVVTPMDTEPEAAQTATVEEAGAQREARVALDPLDPMPAVPSVAPRTAESDPPDAPIAAASTTPTLTRVGYAPIVRVDTARREIELCATSEAIDSYGTVFDYEASKDAFARWIGNVREMHERRAVGRRVAVRCDDDARRVYVRVRISTGAQDTWEKIGDGTLRGASIGASSVIWTFQTRRVAGRDQVVQVATAYELVELSLVDNPSNPDALGITIVRAAEPVEALLAELEDAAMDGGTEGADPRDGDGVTENAEIGEARGGRGEGTENAKVREEREVGEERATAEGAEGRRARGEEIEAAQPQAGDLDKSAAHHRLRAVPTGHSERSRGPFSDNVAGAPDMGVPARAPEPAPTSAGMPAAGNARERFHAAARGIMQGCGCGLCEAALAALEAPAEEDEGAAARSSSSATTGAVREAALVRAVAAGLAAEARQVERMEASMRALDDALRAALGGMGATLDNTLGDLRARLERIEAQPLPGGPALRAVEKSHALEALAGKLSDPQAQIAVAAELIRLRAHEGR